MARISPLRLRDMRRPEFADRDRWFKVLDELGDLILARVTGSRKSACGGIEVSYEIDHEAIECLEVAFDGAGDWFPGNPEAWKG